MDGAIWLPLTDYSSKYKVSVSTLRRRIKTEDIQFKFDDGKYFIIDEPAQQNSQRGHRPSLNSEPPLLVVEKESSPSSTSRDEAILDTANRLMHELKKAYSQILQEKEEQLLHLKGEVTDLKTLVRVLESENERLKSYYR
jgi:hypothetical protein